MKRPHLSAALLATLLLVPAAYAQPTGDPIMDSTDNLFSLMLGKNMADASLVLTALRSTRDPQLLPVFARLAQRPEPEMQLGAMVAIAVAKKDPAAFDLDKALACPNALMVRAAVSLLLDEKLMTDEQLQKMAATSTDNTLKVMALSELQQRKLLPDRKPLIDLLKDQTSLVRYYAAFSLLSSPEPKDVELALQTLHTLTWPAAEADQYNPRDLNTQGIVVLRIRHDKLAAGIPWVVDLTKDEKIDESLRFAATETLLEMKRFEGPAALAQMVANPPKVPSKQIRLALMALQYAPQLKGGLMAAFEKSDSPILATVAGLAHQAADGTDVSAGLVKVLNQGQPFIMDWALVYAETAEPGRQMLLRKTLIENSAIVDDLHGRDFEHAALAAEKIASQNTPEGRAILKQYLHSDNRAVVEAVLAGIYRSTATDQSELVKDFWTRFQEHQSGPYENAANYAALTLSREGKPDAKTWLGGMVQGGTVQDVGFRALAGWYYAKMSNQADALAKRFAERK